MHPQLRLTAVALFAVLLNRPSYAQAPMGEADSTAIARELAAWDALQKKNSGAAFVKVMGNSPRVTILGPDGVTRMSAAELGKSITTSCDRRKNQLDSARVERVGSDVVLLTYRTSVAGRCGSDTTWTMTTLYSMSVWARRGGAWQAVAQAWAPSMK